MKDENKNNKLIEEIYLSREDKIDEIIKNANKEIKEKLIEINKEKILKKYNNNDLDNLIKNIGENNNIRISYLNKKIYEQGFIDGVNLLIECLYK